MLPAMPGDSNFLEDTIFTLSDIWYNIHVIHRNGLEESFFCNTFTKINVKGVGMQQLAADKIGLKFIITLRTLQKIFRFYQHNLEY